MSTFKGFSSTKLMRPKRSQFDLSHERRLTTDIGTLTPCFVTECVPSDTFRGSTEVLLRLGPLLAPIFDRINLFVHYFFVPNRLLWVEWEKFITGGRLGVGVDPLTAPIPPRCEIEEHLADFGERELSDYLGCPSFARIDPVAANWANKYVDLMPFAAYQCVWFNYYRDRNFIADDVFGTTDNGNFPPLASGTLVDAGDYTTLRQRSFHHDYFTSALPFAQRGEEVLMPVELGGDAPLYVNPPSTTPSSATVSGITQPGSIAVGYTVAIDETLPTSPSSLWVKGEDFDGTSTSINDFRAAFALQVWLERNAVGGSRYNESTFAHFGVKPQDSRLQRPEYIGGGKIPVQISEVVSTAWSTNPDTSTVVPQANMAGHGITYGNTNKFNYYCTEHGFILGILSIMPVTSYQQGLPRMFRRRSFLDYPWPTFAKLGEQPVYDYEIYSTPASLTENADGEFPEFGFQSRYADWKWMPTTNHGYFKTDFFFWRLTREFADAPVLGADFVTVPNNLANNIFADQSGYQNFWLYCHNKISVIRPLPYFGVPNTMGFV